MLCSARQPAQCFLKTYFTTDEESIYFLCVLGDCLLKKNVNNLLYFIKPNTKYLISAIDYIIYTTFGYSIANNFIVKYHSTHETNNYRLIKSKTNSSIGLLRNTINEIGLELICVASYYSNVHNNSDNYIQCHLDSPISDYIMHFVRNTPEQIIDHFINNYIETASKSSNENIISWKNMHYIWKIYLHTEKIPTFMYTSTLQNVFSEKLSHDTSVNGEIYFKEITSKYLPNVSSFLSFWNENIVITSENNEILEQPEVQENFNTFDEIDWDYDYDYEINEIFQLYKNSPHKTGYLNCKNVLRIINHYFFPNIKIINDKYIKGIKCHLWDKDNEIHEFLQSYKYNLSKFICPLDKYISIDKLYDSYKKNVSNKNLIIGKHYFHKYISFQLQHSIVNDTLIDIKWFEL